MDILTSGSEKEFRLGEVARTMDGSAGLLAREPIVLSARQVRYPAGPAIEARKPAAILDEEPERWDGLY